LAPNILTTGHTYYCPIDSENKNMSWVIARPGENIESLLRRFKKAVENSGILADIKKNEFYEKPSIRKKRKQAAARKRAIKKEKKMAGQSARKRSNQNFKWNRDRTKKLPLPPPKKYTPRGQSNNRSEPNTRGNDNRNTPNTRNNSGKNYGRNSPNPRSTPNKNANSTRNDTSKGFTHRPYIKGSKS